MSDGNRPWEGNFICEGTINVVGSKYCCDLGNGVNCCDGEPLRADGKCDGWVVALVGLDREAH
jgi:hypothetical protein